MEFNTKAITLNENAPGNLKYPL